MPTGYARDGGLFVPHSIPVVSRDVAAAWKGLGYSKIVGKILRLFTAADEITDAEIAGLINYINSYKA